MEKVTDIKNAKPSLQKAQGKNMEGSMQQLSPEQMSQIFGTMGGSVQQEPTLEQKIQHIASKIAQVENAMVEQLKRHIQAHVNMAAQAAMLTFSNALGSKFSVVKDEEMEDVIKRSFNFVEIFHKQSALVEEKLKEAFKPSEDLVKIKNELIQEQIVNLKEQKEKNEDAQKAVIDEMVEEGSNGVPIDAA